MNVTLRVNPAEAYQEMAAVNRKRPPVNATSPFNILKCDINCARNMCMQ